MGWKTERVQDMASGIVVGGECGSLLHSDNTRPDIRTYARPRLGRASRQSPRQGKSPTTSLPLPSPTFRHHMPREYATRGSARLRSVL
jgi:hypothetical protein